MYGEQTCEEYKCWWMNTVAHKLKKSTYLATLGFILGTILLFLQATVSASETSCMTGTLPWTSRTPSTSPICRMPWLRLPPGLWRGGTGP